MLDQDSASTAENCYNLGFQRLVRGPQKEMAKLRRNQVSALSPLRADSLAKGEMEHRAVGQDDFARGRQWSHI